MLRNPTDLDTLSALMMTTLAAYNKDKVLTEDEMEKGKEGFKNLFLVESIAPLIHALNNNISQCNSEPFRVVEIGCGASPLMYLVVLTLARYYNKQFSFVGIDIDNEAIATQQQNLIKLPSKCYVAADASNLDWFTQVDRKKFDTAILINPVVQDPIKAALLSKESAEKNPRFQQLHTQYQQFQKIFTETLPACLKPNGNILIKARYSEEYRAAIDLLAPMVRELPEIDQEVPKHQCLITKITSPQNRMSNSFDPTLFADQNTIESKDIGVSIKGSSLTY